MFMHRQIPERVSNEWLDLGQSLPVMLPQLSGGHAPIEPFTPDGLSSLTWQEL